jgi:serine/threonine protein kinase
LNVVDYLHDHAVIHRDIKPANIKMRPDGKLILVDFGLAKIYVPGQRTYTGARGMGSPGFAAPEQYSTGTDARSDIYSVGAVMYYMLTGEPPPEAIALGAGTSLVPPRQKRPDLSIHIQSVVFKAMALNPTNRYQSVAEMRRALMSPILAKSSPPLPAVETDSTIHSRPVTNPVSNRPDSQSLVELKRKHHYPLAIIVVGLGLIILILLVLFISLVIFFIVFQLSIDF